jgi:hypothetical protein
MNATAPAYTQVIHDICHLRWSALSSAEMVDAAWAYYFFSIQFRESLTAARSLYPQDEKLMQLEREECDTDNLSPWPGVTQAGERVNHDEFMRRLLTLGPVSAERRAELEAIGAAYLARTRAVDRQAQAASIASYEDGGLEAVFKAILTYTRWDNALLQAFQHFLSQHILFDSDPDGGHGSLSRHITVDDNILPLWQAFHDVLVQSVPALAHPARPELQVAAE